MSALMGKGKPPFPAELTNLEGLNKARIHQDLIAVQRDGILHAVFLDDVLGICISCQPADASVRRKRNKRHSQPEIFLRELVDWCSAWKAVIVNFLAEEELVEVLRYCGCDFFNFLLGLVLY